MTDDDSDFARSIENPINPRTKRDIYPVLGDITNRVSAGTTNRVPVDTTNRRPDPEGKEKVRTMQRGARWASRLNETR